MINSRHFNKILVLLLVLALVLCALLIYFAKAYPTTKVVEYKERLFGDEVVTIDIQINAEDWQALLDNPTAKEYVPADLVINGELFSSVGLRTKGNSSLTQVANRDDNDRYSLHFKFNKYQKGRTYYGLDTFCINNILGDTTYMKDYLSYHLMDYMGVPAPLMNYAEVTVNGEYFGFYLALERYEKSFLARTYNTTGGQLYNVKMQMGQPDADFNPQRIEQAGIFSPDNLRHLPDGRGGISQFETNDNPPNQQVQGGRRMGGRGGGDLVYVDDNISSYSSIFENAEFKKNSDKNKERVILAIKNLNEGKNLEKYFDVDQTLRYLAAHTVVVNLDSYSSSMAQNYYIYELNGKISILPWDYGLAFGGFQNSSAGSVINFPIDTPVSGVSMEERPLISKLLEVPEYKEKYHAYLTQIVEEYFDGGIFAETIASLDAKINEYVKNDTTSFVTYEQYVASLPILHKLGSLRAKSIAGQLDGTIPSTTDGQAEHRGALVGDEGINLSALGSFGGGGNIGGMPGVRGDNREQEFPWNQGDETELPRIPENQGRPQRGQDENRPNGQQMPGDDREWQMPEIPWQNVPGGQNSNILKKSDTLGYCIVSAMLLLLLLAATYFLKKVERKY